MQRLLTHLLIVLSCLTGSAQAANTGSKAAPEAAKNTTLLFFMNPNGAPCQMQLQIIDSIRAKLEKQVNIVPVSTANFGDQAQFRKYGIRYLPALLVVDGNQQELRRFPPGIQSAEEILKEISRLNGKAS